MGLCVCPLFYIRFRSFALLALLWKRHRSDLLDIGEQIVSADHSASEVMRRGPVDSFARGNRRGVRGYGIARTRCVGILPY